MQLAASMGLQLSCTAHALPLFSKVMLKQPAISKADFVAVWPYTRTVLSDEQVCKLGDADLSTDNLVIAVASSHSLQLYHSLL